MQKQPQAIHLATIEMTGTEANPRRRVFVHVQTTKLFRPATYMSSWAGYFSRLAMVDPRSPCVPYYIVYYIHTEFDKRPKSHLLYAVLVCRWDDVNAIPYACAVLLIGGIVRFTDSWSLTSSLRVGHRLASLVDSTRESILALRCNFWCLQGAQSWPR